jgi:hypothetical protein
LLARLLETSGYTRDVKAIRLVAVMVLVPLLVAAIFNSAYWLVSTLVLKLGH